MKAVYREPVCSSNSAHKVFKCVCVNPKNGYMGLKTAIESKPHLDELNLTCEIYWIGKGYKILLDGGSGKKTVIPAALAPYLRRSVDIDVIMKKADAESMLRSPAGLKKRARTRHRELPAVSTNRVPKSPSRANAGADAPPPSSSGA